tara:strand:- start:38 stop:334 length:297 start_codon:yes stop_codon:yes gene_type:complete
MTKLSESSEFTIPLKNLLALIAGTGLAVWAYFGVESRLSFLEHEQSMMMIEVEENDNWIDEWSPPASVEQNIQRVRAMELQLKELQMKLIFLEEKVSK